MDEVTRMRLRERAREQGKLYPLIFARWHRQFPRDDDRDPREPRPCYGCDQTFAWRGYQGLCGWCYEARLSKATA